MKRPSQSSLLQIIALLVAISLVAAYENTNQKSHNTYVESGSDDTFSREDNDKYAVQESVVHFKTEFLNGRKHISISNCQPKVTDETRANVPTKAKSMINEVFKRRKIFLKKSQSLAQQPLKIVESDFTFDQKLASEAKGQVNFHTDSCIPEYSQIIGFDHQTPAYHNQQPVLQFKNPLNNMPSAVFEAESLAEIQTKIENELKDLKQKVKQFKMSSNLAAIFHREMEMKNKEISSLRAILLDLNPASLETKKENTFSDKNPHDVLSKFQKTIEKKNSEVEFLKKEANLLQTEMNLQMENFVNKEVENSILKEKLISSESKLNCMLRFFEEMLEMYDIPLDIERMLEMDAALLSSQVQELLRKIIKMQQDLAEKNTSLIKQLHKTKIGYFTLTVKNIKLRKALQEKTDAMDHLKALNLPEFHQALFTIKCVENAQESNAIEKQQANTKTTSNNAAKDVTDDSINPFCQSTVSVNVETLCNQKDNNFAQAPHDNRQCKVQQKEFADQAQTEAEKFSYKCSDVPNDIAEKYRKALDEIDELRDQISIYSTMTANLDEDLSELRKQFFESSTDFEIQTRNFAVKSARLLQHAKKLAIEKKALAGRAAQFSAQAAQLKSISDQNLKLKKELDFKDQLISRFDQKIQINRLSILNSRKNALSDVAKECITKTFIMLLQDVRLLHSEWIIQAKENEIEELKLRDILQQAEENQFERSINSDEEDYTHAI